MTEQPETRMAAGKNPFAESRYNLASWGLQVLDDQRARAVSGMLALMDPWLRLGYTKKGLLDYLIRDDPSLHRYAVVASEETAGVICVRHPWLRGPYLELLAVFPPYQGRRLGTALIDWISDECRGLPVNVWTTASEFNTAALSFYKYTGFVAIAELQDLVKGGCSEILLRKKCR